MTNTLGLERPLVLVLGGEQEVLDEISAMLIGAGFDCRCCTTAEEAIAAALANPPDLIVCDLNLHDESGMETCQQIKQQSGLQDVPVMFLSGNQRPDVIRRTHITGDRGYCLRKPLAPKVFLGLIDQTLGSTACVPNSCS